MEEKRRISVLLGVLVVCTTMMAPAGLVVAGPEQAGNATTTEVEESVTETATDSETSDETTSSTETDTPTATEGSTETETEDREQSDTPTPTESPTATNTETVAETETTTETATSTETETETATTTATETETPTETSTPTATSTETPTETETSTETSTSSETPTSTETEASTETETETELDASTNVTASADSTEANETEATDEVTERTRNTTTDADQVTNETTNDTAAVDEPVTNDTSDSSNTTGQTDETSEMSPTTDEPANDSGESVDETRDSAEESTEAPQDAAETESVNDTTRSATADPTESETNESQAVTNESVESTDNTTQSAAGELVESANDTSESIANETVETANDTIRSAAKDSVESVSDSTPEGTNETGATANDTAETTADSRDEVLNQSNRSSTELVETANDTTRSTEEPVETLNATTKSVTDDSIETVDDATGTVADEAVETATDLSGNVTEATAGFGADTTDSERELEGVLSTTENAVDETTADAVGAIENETEDSDELTNATLGIVETRNELSNTLENTTRSVTNGTEERLGGVTTSVDPDGTEKLRVTDEVATLQTDAIDVTVEETAGSTNDGEGSAITVHPTVSESVDDVPRTVANLRLVTQSATVATDDVPDAETVEPGFGPSATGTAIVEKPPGAVESAGEIELDSKSTGADPVTTDTSSVRPHDSTEAQGPAGEDTIPTANHGDHQSTVDAGGFQSGVEVQNRHEGRHGSDSNGDVRPFDGEPLPDEEEGKSISSRDSVRDDPDQRADTEKRSNARAADVGGDQDRPSVPDVPVPDDAIPVLLAVITMAGAVAVRNGAAIAGPIASTPVHSVGIHARTVVRRTRVGLGKIPRIFPIPGYSRYDDSDPLENEHRARLHETITTAPGLDLATLVKRADVSRSTARYHLRILEHEGEVTREEVWGKSRVYPSGTDDLERQAAVQSRPMRAVLEAIRRHEPASGTAIAADLGRDVSTVSHHLDRLDEVGLIDRERDGRAVRNRLAPEARELTPWQRDGYDASGSAVSSDD